MPDAIIIHTDGACAGNPGPGGFAAIIENPKYGELVITGGDPRTTNNRMELSAVIEALKAVNSAGKDRSPAVTVRSDSKYITDCFNQDWIAGWKRNGWRTAKKQPVLNQDLWEELLAETKGRSVSWEWVKGHNGDPMNERCDRMAVAQAQAAGSQPSYWVNVGNRPMQEKEPARESAAVAAPIDPAGEQQAGVPNRPAIYREIEQERRRQDAIYGPPSPEQHRHGHYTWNAILNEETGEISRALLKDNFPNLRQELVQTAAVITAWIEFIDQKREGSAGNEVPQSEAF